MRIFFYSTFYLFSFCCRKPAPSAKCCCQTSAALPLISESISTSPRTSAQSAAPSVAPSISNPMSPRTACTTRAEWATGQSPHQLMWSLLHCSITSYHCLVTEAFFFFAPIVLSAKQLTFVRLGVLSKPLSGHNCTISSSVARSDVLFLLT